MQAKRTELHPKRVVIFDADDTLWRTQELYDQAKQEFEQVLRNESFHTENIVGMLEDIEIDEIPKLGFSKERFINSLSKTYEVLCAKERRQRNVKLESKIKAIGETAFQTPKLYEDAVASLERLSKYYALVLATKGDTQLQKSKIKQLGVGHFFLKIYTLARKTELEYSQILSDLSVPKERLWVVGNSVKSDIKPAVKLNLRSILIPRGAWRYEQDQIPSESVIVASSLSEAADIIISNDCRTTT
jgi:putative hydrolase of the HAD superfamily